MIRARGPPVHRQAKDESNAAFEGWDRGMGGGKEKGMRNGISSSA